MAVDSGITISSEFKMVKIVMIKRLFSSDVLNTSVETAFFVFV